MTVSVIAVDLDGTLLRSDKTVSARTVKALASAAEAGARMVIVTARPPRFADLLAREAGIGGVAVCSNGAIVYDLDGGDIEVVGPLPVASARRAAEAVSAVLPGAAFAVETGQVAVLGPGYGHVAARDDARMRAASLDELWALAGTPVKLLVWSLAEVTDALLERVAAGLPRDVVVTYSGAAGMMEIHAAGVSKVGALARLCREWKVDPADVIAFGDMPNDLPVMQWAGHSVAVANAHPRVLAAATEVTAGNNEDGVAVVLERMFC